MSILILLLLSFLDMNHDIKVPQPPIADHQYRAAKYRIVEDLSEMQAIVPEMSNSQVIHAFFVQYGDSLIIELAYPGSKSPYMPYMVASWDYKNRRYKAEMILDAAQRYYPSSDTILFSIEANQHTVKYLCAAGAPQPACDSMLITSHENGEEYFLYVNNTIDNIKSHQLFYPGIQYLPVKIVKNGKRKATWTFEEMIDGKQAIDSLLQLYQQEGYEASTKEQWGSNDHLVPDEVNELLKQVEEIWKE